MQAQRLLEDEEWEVVKAGSAQTPDAQPIHPALVRELGLQVAQAVCILKAGLMINIKLDTQRCRRSLLSHRSLHN